MQLKDAHQRVLSVSAVQQHLHLAGRNEPIEIANYLAKLCETLAQSMIGDSRPISLKVEADAGTAVSREAVSIGLIVTELQGAQDVIGGIPRNTQRKNSVERKQGEKEADQRPSKQLGCCSFAHRPTTAEGKKRS